MNNDALNNLRRRLLCLLLTRAVEDRKELASPGNLSNEIHHEDGNGGTGHNSQDNGNGQKGRFNYKNVLIEVVLIAVGSGFFTSFNDFLEFLGVHGSKPWCILGGLICIEFAVAHWFLKHLEEFATAVKAVFAIAVVTQFVAVLCVVLFGQKPQKPHVHFVLNTAGAPNAEILLTNDFLKPGKDWFKWSDVRAKLIIPVPSPQSSVTLKWSVHNGSYLSVESVSSIIFVGETNLPVSPGGYPGFTWTKAVRPGGFQLGENSFKAFSFASPFLNPGRGQAFPDLNFTDIKDWINKPIRIWATAQLKDSAPSGISFFMYFILSTNSTIPVLTTNDTDSFPPAKLKTLPRNGLVFPQPP